jgi:hypothetical protein
MRIGFKLAAAVIAVAAVGTTLADPAPSGLRVYGEIWNPTKIDGESLSSLVNEPTGLSDAMLGAWTGFRTWYLVQVPAKLHTQDFLHSVNSKVPSGITLYARSHNMQAPPTLSLPASPQLLLQPQGTDSFSARFHVAGAGIGVCATTPTALGSYADPCADLSVDLDVTFSVSISDVPGQLLKIGNIIASPSNFQISDPNFPVEVAQVINSINAFFGGTDFQQLLANLIAAQSQNLSPYVQGPINSVNAAVANVEQSALSSINKELAPAGVSLPSLLHIALWEQNSANSQMLTLLLAPPASGVTLDASHQSGQVNGVLTFDASVQTPPATCANLNNSTTYADRVQTGPRTVLSIDSSGRPTYGGAPFQSLTVGFTGGAVQARQCNFSFTHLALGLPNSITLTGQQSTALAQRLQTLELTPVDWGNPVVVAPAGVILAVGTPPANQLAGKTAAFAGSAGVAALAASSGQWSSQTSRLAQENAHNSLALLASMPASGVAKINPAPTTSPPSGWATRAGSAMPASAPASSRLGTVPSWGGTSTQGPPAPSALQSH